MLKINENTIYDPATGICYTLGEGWNYVESREEAEKAGKIWACVYVNSIHASGETYGLTFEKADAVRFWELLSAKVQS